MQAKLKENNNSIHNYTQVVKNNTYIIVNKSSSYVVAASTLTLNSRKGQDYNNLAVHFIHS